jgi:hypothetical protein
VLDADIRRFYDATDAGDGVERRGSPHRTSPDTSFDDRLGLRKSPATSLLRAGSRAGNIASCDPLGCTHQRWKQQSAAAHRRGHRTCAFAQQQASRPDPATRSLQTRTSTDAQRTDTSALRRVSRRDQVVSAGASTSSQAGVCSGPAWTLALARKAAVRDTSPHDVRGGVHDARPVGADAASV